jgi:hypothetical protein
MRMLQANSPIAGAWRRNVEVEVKPSRIWIPDLDGME